MKRKYMKRRSVKATLIVGLLAVLLVSLPLLGVWLDGRRVRPYLALTANPVCSEAAPFSWAVFVVMGTVLILILAPFALHLFRAQRDINTQKTPPAGRLPWWGRVGLFLFLLSWIFAWTRFPWFAPFQAHTFEPLWLSFILVINGVTHKRTGRCLLTDAPLYLLSLFVVSPFFWWFFEYLNRFVGNWYYYIGPGELTALKGYSSLAFSTVLPGIASTSDLLGSFPRIRAGMDRFIRIVPSNRPLVPWLSILFSSTVLAGIGIWPDVLFPALWLSPLLLTVSVQHFTGYTTIFSPVKTGDWTYLWLMAISGLACGFLWELWNAFSLAHWKYAVPYVGRFHIFEMPLLGYSGYLPFGLECGVMCDCMRRLFKIEN